MRQGSRSAFDFPFQGLVSDFYCPTALGASRHAFIVDRSLFFDQNPTRKDRDSGD
jgi:hypothetical protein